MAIGQQISLGIGSPASIGWLITLGLGDYEAGEGAGVSITSSPDYTRIRTHLRASEIRPAFTGRPRLPARPSYTRPPLPPRPGRF